MHHLPTVLVLEEDLLFGVRIEKTLKTLGYMPQRESTPDKALAFAEENSLALCIVNFNSKHYNAVAFAAQFKAITPSVTLLGYLSHKIIPEVRPAAKAAGCDLLVPNSSIATRLPLLLAKLAPHDGGLPDAEGAAHVAEEAEEG
jgi:DNA-binding NtrC family response regulator